MPRQSLIKVRRGTAAEWNSANPVLDEGELGFATDTGEMKIGNGSDSWLMRKHAGSDADTAKLSQLATGYRGYFQIANSGEISSKVNNYQINTLENTEYVPSEGDHVLVSSGVARDSFFFYNEAQSDWTLGADAYGVAELAQDVNEIIVDNVVLEGEVTNLIETQCFETESVLYNTNLSVYADGAAGSPDPLNQQAGWYFQNSGGSNKINWYYVANINPEAIMTLDSFRGQYMVVTIRSTVDVPFFNVYTARQFNGGDAGSWYRSRLTYSNLSAFAGRNVGDQVLLYWGVDPAAYLDMPHIECTLDGASSSGPAGSEESLLTASVSTSSNVAAGNYAFVCNNFGYVNANHRKDYILEAQSDLSDITANINDIGDNVLALTTGRFFRGFMSDAAEVQAVTTPIEKSYVINNDTNTVWQYQSAAWTDTGVSASAPQAIASAEEAAQSDLILVPESGALTIETTAFTRVIHIGTGDQGYEMYGGSNYNRGGIKTAEKIHNAAEWFEFNNLQLGLNNAFNGMGITKAGTTASGSDSGTSQDVGGSLSNYEDDLFDGVNSSSKGVYFWVGFTNSGLWTVGGSVILTNHAAFANSDLFSGGGQFRIGIDADGKMKAQFWCNNANGWVTCAYTSGNADVHPEGYKWCWRPYRQYAQINQLPVSRTLQSGSNGGALPAYADTHYVDLDGTNDYLELTGTNNVMDFSSSWSIGVEIRNISSVNDNSYVTLFKSGTNEVCLRKGGSNWGIYCFCNGNSIAQANTWYTPDDSKILITCDGTVIKYYINNVKRASMTINQTNLGNHNAPTTDELHIGQGGVTGNHWYGGIDHLTIMDAILGNDQRTEYFTQSDIRDMSFYTGDVLDFLPLGEGVFPSVDGIKGVVTGNLENGISVDFVQK